VRQEPVIRHEQAESEIRVGTVVRVPLRNLAKAEFDDETDLDEEGDDWSLDSPGVNSRCEVAILTNRHRLRVAQATAAAVGASISADFVLAGVIFITPAGDEGRSGPATSCVSSPAFDHGRRGGRHTGPFLFTGTARSIIRMTAGWEAMP
jgi:hypothetical protein